MPQGTLALPRRVENCPGTQQQAVRVHMPGGATFSFSLHGITASHLLTGGGLNGLSLDPPTLNPRGVDPTLSK